MNHMGNNDAIFGGPNHEYRYVLSREIPRHVRTGRLLWVMLNPSKATATIDDPTIRKCMGFGRVHGYHTMRVVNLFAYRATNPKELLAVDDPVGPSNDHYVMLNAAWADDTILAWGNVDPRLLRRSRWFFGHRVKDLLFQLTTALGNKPVYTLGLTKDGHPRHPVRLPYATPLTPFTL